VPDDLSPVGQSSSFDLLHEHVRRWIWKQRWIELRDIQERSIPALLDGSRDLVISAGTASGKTEAAFLPIVSRIASTERVPGAGFDAIYISPLRALINDQFGRMEGLCEEMEIRVTKWHGDVAASSKAKALAKPSGIVLITPESLEATMVRKGPEIRRLCRGLAYVVVDEMHAFMDAPRGKQLQSILHRLEIATGARVTRVGLSATLADEAASQRFLRPLAPNQVEVHRSKASPNIRLQVRGYIEPVRPPRPDKEALLPGGGVDPANTAESEIIKHLFSTLRGKRSLIFAGSRRRVETTTVGLSGLTEAIGVPEEFFAHHGNLSRDHREEAERRMKDMSRPASVVCTTTLELGIDVGAIDSVAQLGPGHTVSGMKQRLGRSGRRAGQVATMRVYVTEQPLAAAEHPLDALRRETVQAVAMLELMLEHWNEPPSPGRLHLSTLMHQILAFIVQHGGITAEQGWKHLVLSGVFEAVDLNTYKRVLRRMGDPDVGLIEQAPDGTLLPGKQGEIVTAGRDFYAVFMGASEFKVIESGGRPIGSVPDNVPFIVDQFLMLAGRRWRVLEVDEPRREIVVVRAHGGQPPKFGGEPVPPSDGVVARMRLIYESKILPTFLDATAAQLLAEARESFDRLGLRHHSVCRHKDRLLIFPWYGPRRQTTLLLALMQAGLKPEQYGLAISVPVEQQVQLRQALISLARCRPPDALGLAALVEAKASDKYDYYLDEELLCAAYAAECLDVQSLLGVAAEILQRWPG
jgi:ATP-dependent helicase Lhr and Lhr-like helicase